MPTAAAPSSAAYRAATEEWALLDRSERGKLALSGAGAKEFLDGQLTNAISELEPGRGCYAAFLTPKGKMLGDVRVLDAGEELLLDTERSTLQALFDMIRRYRIGYDIELHKRTLQCALFSLLGPQAPRASAGAGEHDHAPGEIAGAPVRFIATDLGCDVLCASEDAERVRAELERQGAIAVDEQLGEVLRVERGRPRYGIDLDESVIPQEAGLNERAVSFTKGCYVGQETVARLHYRGRPNRHLRGLRLPEPGAPGEEVRLGERVVGRLGSSVVSPAHGPIALALLRREAEPGAQVALGERGAEAEVCELPF